MLAVFQFDGTTQYLVDRREQPGTPADDEKALAYVLSLVLPFAEFGYGIAWLRKPDQRKVGWNHILAGSMRVAYSFLFPLIRSF